MNAPTPLPYTPALYLKGGGSGFFSKHRHKLLVASRMNLDWCGSYGHVPELNEAAKRDQ